MPATIANGLLLLAQATLYFAFMATLFRLRPKLGLGVLTAALGTLHFVETYLAGVFYVATPLGVVSPGSSVMFSGKLMILLLIYIKEDAATVRQPIYGILAGNLLTLVLAFALRSHEVVVFAPDALPPAGFVETIGGLMVWGTALLYIDALAVILLYEKLGSRLRDAFFLRVALSLGAVLAFDQAAFYLALRWFAGVPIDAFYAGLQAKLCAAVLYAALAALYMRFAERPGVRLSPSLSDTFQVLTYRERFEALAEHTGRDRTTMLFNRRSFETQLADERIERLGQPVTIVLIEVDDAVFREIEGRLGRRNSEALLRTVARCLEETAHDRDDVFRLDHRQFAAICRCPPPLAQAMVERLRILMRQRSEGYGTPVTMSVGASGVERGGDVGEALARAEGLLAKAREAGGNAVLFSDPTESEPARAPPGQPAFRAP